MLALAEQHRTARFQLPREGGAGLAGAGDVLAVGLGRLGRGVDLGRALADRDDELRRAGRVAGDLAGGGILLGHRAVDGVEHRADRLDRLRDAVHGVGRAGGVALERVDLPGDLLRRTLGLHRERLHFGGDDRKALAGRTRTRGLDGRVECEQRRLPRDLGDQIDDIADGGGGFAQAVDIGAGFLRRGAGFVGELASLAHLRADALRGLGELVGGMGKGGGGRLRCIGAAGEGVGALADIRERCRGRLRAAGH
ncbi:hypothetical protein ACVMGC_004580 [Bradyrhizobium barranii subsp. barranii]